jgi:hypothetical protein
LCNVRAKTESEAISGLAKRLSRAGRACAHLVLLPGVVRDTELVRKLMDHQAALLERLSEDMKRYALKHNATLRPLETKEEITAAERALSPIAGHRNVTASGAYVATDRCCELGSPNE